MTEENNKKNLYNIPIPSEQVKEYLNLPTSPGADLIYTVLGEGDNIDTLGERKKAINHHTQIGISKNPNNNRQVRVNQTTATGEVTIELADINKLMGKKNGTKKLFVLALVEANKQAIFGGILERNSVTFSLQDLVDNGFYSSLRSARSGFTSGADALTSLKLRGKITNGKKNTAIAEQLEVLFTGYSIKKNQCTLYLNDRIDWGAVTQYYTLLPSYYWSLSNRASDLLYYIFYIARQNTKKIAEQGYFNITFRAIQYKLNLPNEKETTHPQRDIKDEINRAIEEIDKNHSITYGEEEFFLNPVCNDNANITEWLDKGYLQVHLEGTIAESFNEIAAKTAAQIEKAQKRQEKIIDTAKANKLTKALEKEAKAEAETEE